MLAKVLFSFILTKINEIFLYFCMQMISFKTFYNLLIVCFVSSCLCQVFAQEAKTIVHGPEKLNSLLETKIALDKETAEQKLYSIQVYYGVFATTTAVLEEFKLLFPSIETQLIFETPNYKIRAGSFTTEREALEALIPVKRKFPAAFVLKP